MWTPLVWGHGSFRPDPHSNSRTNTEMRDFFIDSTLISSLGSADSQSPTRDRVPFGAAGRVHFPLAAAGIGNTCPGPHSFQQWWRPRIQERRTCLGWFAPPHERNEERRCSLCPLRRRSGRAGKGSLELPFVKDDAACAPGSQAASAGTRNYADMPSSAVGKLGGP